MKPETKMLLVLVAYLVLVMILSALMGGCAARRPAAASLVITVPRACLIDAQLTPKTECEGPDLEHLDCKGIKLTKKKGCELATVKLKKGK